MRYPLLACSLAMNLVIDFGSDGTAIAQPAETVKQWTFNTDGDNEGWTGTNCLRDVVVQDGVLRGIVTGRDPFIVVSGLDIPARPWNLFQTRLRIVQDGPLLDGGELFYANSNQGPFGGFSRQKRANGPLPMPIHGKSSASIRSGAGRGRSSNCGLIFLYSQRIK